MRRRLLTLFPVLLLALVLCACQSGAENTPTPPAKDDPPVVSQGTEQGSGVKVLTAQDWAETYPEIYASYLKNSENSSVTEYPEDYPMIPVLYEGIGFAKFYSSARGHAYTVEDVTSTGRPHALANCFTCKTPDFTNMVNEMGDAAYQMSFEDALKSINEPISCYNCHANTGSELVVTHTYLANAMGDDLANVNAKTLACAQCHVEYYFDPSTKATTLPYSSLATMNPDDILDYYNQMMVDGQPFADYTNPRTGVRQIKVQHPEYETFMGAGSIHAYGLNGAMTFTCADCHMGREVSEDGVSYVSHYYISPLENQTMLDKTCSICHADITAEVRAIQEEIEERTYSIGYLLEDLTEKLAEAVESGSYTDEELDAVRAVARNAQFYWDFVFVENSEGAHNSSLDRECLDKAEALTNQALEMLQK